MMAGKRGYRDILNFSDDSEMMTDYYGLIARGNRYFLAHYHNVNDGQHTMTELDASQAKEIEADWKSGGWSLGFVEKWVTGLI